MTTPTTFSKHTDDPVRGLYPAQVEISRPICREHYLLRLRTHGRFPATSPGQFIQLGCRPVANAMATEALMGGEWDWVPGSLPQVRQVDVCERLAILRKPFSLAGRGDDAQGSWLEIVHRVVGAGTSWLAQLKTGDAVDLIGPLGNRFELSAGKSLGLLVGGGVGLPPMFYLAQALYQANWRAKAFVGAMTRDLLAVDWTEELAPQPKQFAQYGVESVITTNDGSLGIKGLITTGLEQVLSGLSREDAQQAVIFTCGPHAMMHAVARLAQNHGVDCQVCLEQAMACGMGTCQSCIVKIEDAIKPQAHTQDGRPWRYKLACTDGPVFKSQQVVW